MKQQAFKYRFKPAVVMEDVRASLVIATLAAEGEFGSARVRLEARYEFDPDNYCCTVRGDTPAGEMIARTFTALLQHELGDDGFTVELVDVGGDDGISGIGRAIAHLN